GRYRMSGCWVCRSVAALSIAATLIAAPDARAKASGLVTVRTHDGRSNRVHIDEHGITVTRTSADSESSRVDVGGDFDAGTIVVHGSGNGIVRLFSDAVVGPAERVDGDVVAVFGSVRVEGEVEGSAVAVFGSLDLRRNSLVRGDAVAVGGGLKQSDGSKVEGQSVQVGFLPLTLGLPGLPAVLVTITVDWLVSVFFGWVAAALFPARLARVAVTSSRRTAASLLLGILSG